MELNKVCTIEDWDSPERAATMRRVLPLFVDQDPAYPRGMEHRKHWEFAQVLLGLDELGAVHPSAMILAVAAGRESVVFDLTNRARWVFATDIYGEGDFVGWTADVAMLKDPDAFALCPFNRRRLVVQYMDALDLRYEDETFDAAYSLSSIEHFGGAAHAARGLAEQRRVVKDGGIVAFTTELIVNEAETLDTDELVLFSKEQLDELCRSLDGLELVEPIDFAVSERTLATARPLAEAMVAAQEGRADYPHLVLETQGRQFTSASVFLRRT